MPTPLHLRDLRVEPALHPRQQPHLSVTSGLVTDADDRTLASQLLAVDLG
ncbi:MAG: hypothetical protein LH617_01260 [Ramlibacter sp.]|nr:hypothetical protein [Ramlibacter sp.]